MKRVIHSGLVGVAFPGIRYLLRSLMLASLGLGFGGPSLHPQSLGEPPSEDIGAQLTVLLPKAIFESKP